MTVSQRRKLIHYLIISVQVVKYAIFHLAIYKRMILNVILPNRILVNVQNALGRISLLTLKLRRLNGDFLSDSPHRLKEAVSVVKGLSG